MYFSKNSTNWVSFSVIAVLFICFSFTSVHSSILSGSEVNSIVLNFDLLVDQESNENEKDFNEDSSNLFHSDFKKLSILKNSTKIEKTKVVCFLPQVFYDIQILPPEVKVN